MEYGKIIEINKDDNAKFTLEPVGWYTSGVHGTAKVS